MRRRSTLSRLVRWFGGALAALVATAAFLGGCVFAGPKYRGPVSDHFDGARFHNPGDVPEHGFAEVLKWQRERRPGEWGDYRDVPPGPRPPPWVGDGKLRVTFINHATTLIQFGGLNILTDPIWSDRCSPVSFAGPHRVRPPGIRFEDLPPIDVVLLSHNHYDHTDLPTLRRLQHAFPKMQILSGLGVDLLLAEARLSNATALDWWQERTLSPAVKAVSVPVQHFSSRGIGDQNATLWTGWALLSEHGWVYFAGDTGYGPHFKAARERLGPPRLAILPIGAYLPEWFMGPVHVTPSQAVQAALDLQARTSVAIHFDTFPLADEAEGQAVEDLRTALAALGDAAPPFWVLAFGEGRDVP